MSTPWYVKAFGDHYEELYAHRNDADAGRALDFLFEQGMGPDRQKGRTLDLCCGAGRHSLAWLRAGGRSIIGMDLAMNLLESARVEVRRTGLGLHLVRGDMLRLPFQTNAFQLVLNLFTSFGYFNEESRNQAVLHEVGRVLIEGGHFVMDHMNPVYLRATLMPESVRTTPGGIEMRETRRILEDVSRVEKTIRFEDESGEKIEVVESVRFYEPGEIEAMAGKAGLRILERYGDFDGRGPGTDAPRAIYIMRKNG
ncbi:MAG: class I SAM-dependent methyltransferase [Candidatus Sumerlaeota bacterium]